MIILLDFDVFPEARNYRGYLVRIWRSGSASPWRASARDTKTGKKYHFTRLEDLFLFLGEETNDDLKPEA